MSTATPPKQQQPALRPPQTPFSNKTAFILGGSGTIGSEVAVLLAANGYNVCLVARNANGLKRAAARIDNSRILCVSADGYQLDALRRAVAECCKTFGGLTLAVCCAGEFLGNKGLSAPNYVQQGQVPKPVCGIEMNFAAAVAPRLRAAGEGSLLFMTSSLVHLLTDYAGWVEHLAWANGVSGIYEGLNTEFRQLGIRVGMLSLFLVRGSRFSRGMQTAIGQGLNPGLKDEANWVAPQDVAKAVYFMTSPEALNANMMEMEVTPQLMMEKNQVFAEVKKVGEMVDKLTAPAFVDGKVALITGAGKGIGRGIALELAEAGYNIVALTRTAKDLDTLETDCVKANPACRVLKIAIDVTNEKDLEAAVQRSVAHFGTLSLVVSNAGTNRRKVAALSGIDVWKEVMNVDLIAAMNLTRLTLPYVLRHAKLTRLSSKPLVAFVSTNYAHPKGIKMPGLSPYIASKAGTNAFAAVVLQEVRDLGVGVLTFCPGTVATDLGMKPNAAAKGGELIDSSYMIQPKDCGRAVVFAADHVGKSTCVNMMNIESLYHIYPAIRKAQTAFLAQGKL